ncbi:MAG: TRL-like family protein [Candidatus Magnetominusculus sp. LBB02]|nr:TRL-like family protein [Candidatus Magnetominusculus sp. LBB02]
MTIRKAVVVLVIMVAAFSVAGCGYVSDGPFGWGMSYHTTPVAKGRASGGYREGQACNYAFFGMVAIGDSGIEAAMRNGGIKDVFTIDSYSQSFFGTYTRQCTVIVGS